MGIEPTFLAWEATFLPLEDTRLPSILGGYKPQWQRPLPDKTLRATRFDP